MSRSKCPAFDVVVPAYNAETTLPQCLAALSACEPAPARVVVYDDGSSDATVAIAEAFGVEVISGRTTGAGPAVGRNAGVYATESPIVVFVDADVAVEPDAPGMLAAVVAGSHDVAGAFGAYGDRAVVSNLAGRYANLRHHYVHVTNPGEAHTFWSGLGAVKRSSYVRASGFDERFTQLEDVELGLRLRAGGERVLLVPEARSAHLKNWTVKQLWRTDIYCRAIPWSKLIVEGRAGEALNTDRAEQVKSILANLIWVVAAAALILPLLWLGVAALATSYLALNRRFFHLLWANSPRVAVAGAGLHWCYHVYASAVYGLVLLRNGFMMPMRRHAARIAAARVA